MLLHRWPHCLSLKSKWLPRYRNCRSQMSYKAFFSLKSPEITLRLGKCLIKVRIYCFLYLNSAFFFFTNYAIFLKLCNRMRFEINFAKSHHHVISDDLLITVTLGTEEGGHCREVTVVERLKQESMYGLSAQKVAIVVRWLLVEVQYYCIYNRRMGNLGNLVSYSITSLAKQLIYKLIYHSGKCHLIGGLEQKLAWVKLKPTQLYKSCL